LAQENKSLVYRTVVRRCLRDPRFSHLRRTLTYHRQTDGRSHDDGKYRASIASRGKNSRESSKAAPPMQ